MENLKDMVEVNTIIGDPVESHDGTIIIPVSKVGFGFAAGGSEFNSNGGSGSQEDSESSSLPFGGGSGGGVSITPVAFLILSKNGVKMVHLDQHTHIYEKIIDSAPQAVEKIQQILKESSTNKNSKHKKQESQKHRDKHDDDQSDDDHKYSNYTI